MDSAANMIGLIGVGLIVVAYGLISTEKLSHRDKTYHILNLIGAVLILLSLLVHWNLPSFVIECVWIAISIYGIWRAVKRKNREN